MDLNKIFPEKRVIITGAGSGLGKALACEFAKRKWNIIIAEINDKRARESAAEVEKLGGKSIALHCDVTKPEDLDKVVETAKKELGGVDIMVNNAGVSAGGFMEKISLEDWDWIININLKSVIYGCRCVIPLFKKQQSGYIINVSSNAGLVCLPEMSSYNMTKAGVIAISETLRTELSSFGIGVSVVCPTFFKTNLMDQFHSPDERQRKLAEGFFDKAHSSAEKVAKCIIKSVSHKHLYIIPQIEGKYLWWNKRHFPRSYFKVSALIYKKGLFYKYLGINPDEL
ncbi:MAG: SDR family oxidoreductase [Syntrophaceae bacterium]|nr:SDR family oxidoreductase [Syntrophaceae bacterium]